MTPATVLRVCGWVIICAIAAGILLGSNLAGLILGTLALPSIAPIIRDWALERRMRREMRSWLDA